MIDLAYDFGTNVVKPIAPVVIVLGGEEPVRVTFAAAPGTVSAMALALGTEAIPPVKLAGVTVFVPENATVYTAVLDTLATEDLKTFMLGKGPTGLNAELIATINGRRRRAPHFQVTVQPPITPLT